MYHALMNKKLYDRILEGLEPDKSISYDAYIDMLEKLSQGSHCWPNPRRIEICKTFSQKRRIVYAYPVEEMFILRAVNHYLCRKYRYALALSYFPSRQRTPAQCLAFILNRREAYINEHPSAKDLFGIHMDISDYFNSMDTTILFECLPYELKNDEDFCKLYQATILNPWCDNADKIMRVDQKGAMAGLPFTAFFAAIYLSVMDKKFEKAGLPYVRYSDDILFFIDNEKSMKDWSECIKLHLTNSRLNINEKKTEYIDPESAWTFIGFEIDNDNIDISAQQLEKLKRRFSKWAKRYRKYVEIGYGKDMRRMPPAKAVASLIKNINRALFKQVRDKYCWAQWAFPTINVTTRLKFLDSFIQEKLRFVYTGCYTKKNYRVLTYSKLKEMGYCSLEKLYMQYRYRPKSFQEFLESFVQQSDSLKTKVMC